MVRKKQSESQEVTDTTTTPPVDEIEGNPAAAEEPKKQYAKRPDPFGVETIKWPDGYRVSLIESDANREIYVQFGNGTKTDSPKNFEAIKSMFKEQHMYWDNKVQGWAKGLKTGVTPLIREDNRKIRSAVTEAFYNAVELEEASRGPSLALQGRQQNAPAR